MNTSASEHPTLAPVPGGPFRRVLVAFDGSADAVAALRTATSLVGGSAGHVVALAVLTAAPHREAVHDGPAEASGQALRVAAAFEATRAASTSAAPARVDLHTMQARQVAVALCDYAVGHGFDLLVVGRHGDGGMLHPRLGHIAETAARTCAVPVLLVSAAP